MVLHTYKEATSPYYVAAFFIISMSDADIESLQWWCYNNFGPGLGEYRVDNSPFVHRWVDDIKWGEIRFRDERDLNWFMLKWG